MNRPVAIVLAAGTGSRMRRDSDATALAPDQQAAAARGLKGMIPDDRGRPFLDHVLSALADGGVRDVCIVVGPDHDAIAEHYTARRPARISVAFAVQAAPTGTADAVLVAAPWTDDRDMLVLNADNLYPATTIAALVELGRPGLVAFDRDALVRQGNIEAERIAAYAILQLRGDDSLESIVEKPTPEQLRGGGNLVSMNLWRFDRTIYPACRDVTRSPRGERELPLAVALAVARGAVFAAVRMATGVLDLSHRGDIGAVAHQLGQREVRP